MRAVFDKHSEEIITIKLLVPTIKVALLREFIRTREAAELIAETFFQFVAEPIHALFFEHIFQPRVFAVCAVAKIPMNGDDAFRDLDDLDPAAVQ